MIKVAESNLSLALCLLGKEKAKTGNLGIILAMKGCLYDFQGIRRSCGINVFIDVYRYHGKDHKLA